MFEGAEILREENQLILINFLLLFSMYVGIFNAVIIPKRSVS